MSAKAIALLLLAVTSMSVAAPSPAPHAGSKATAMEAPAAATKQAPPATCPTTCCCGMDAELDSDRRALESQADRYYTQFNSLVDHAFTYLSVCVALLMGFFFWVFGKTHREAKAVIKEMFENQAKPLIEKESAELLQRYREVSTQLQALTAYKARPVTWIHVGNQDEIGPMLEMLYTNGLQRIATLVADDAFHYQYTGEALVIVTYDGSSKAQRILRDIVGALSAVQPPVFLVIYTPGNVRLDREQLDVLGRYIWYVPVNFPMQLLFQVPLLLQRSMPRGEEG